MNVSTLKDLIFNNQPADNQAVIDQYTGVSQYSIRWQQGENLLHWAAASNNVPLCQFAIDSGFEVNAFNIHCETALYFASIHNSRDAVIYLLSVGADPYFISNFTGKYPIQVATDPNIIAALQASIDNSPFTMINNELKSKQENKTKLYLYRLYRRRLKALYSYVFFRGVPESDVDQRIDDEYKATGIDAVSVIVKNTRIAYTQYQDHTNTCLVCDRATDQLCPDCGSVKLCSLACQQQANELHSIDC